MSALKKEITIKVSDENERIEVATKIHEQLKTNMDYKMSNIVVFVDADDLIKIYIFEGCVTDPKIVI